MARPGVVAEHRAVAGLGPSHAVKSAGSETRAESVSGEAHQASPPPSPLSPRAAERVGKKGAGERYAAAPTYDATKMATI